LFSSYAAIVKNLRGVVLLDLDEEGALTTVEWLVKRFRYRDLGVTPTTYNKYQDRLRKYMEGKPFRLLSYPIAELKEFASEFSSCTGLEEELAEALVTASIYISPIMVISKKYSDAIDKLSVEKIKTCKKLSTRDWKLHMRIADYSVLDMYEFSINGALRVIESCSRNELSRIINDREKAVRRDTKRYWRIRCEEQTGEVFLYYIDNLKLYADKCGLEGACGKSNFAAALSIIPVVNIPLGQT